MTSPKIEELKAWLLKKKYTELTAEIILEAVKEFGEPMSQESKYKEALEILKSAVITHYDNTVGNISPEFVRKVVTEALASDEKCPGVLCFSPPQHLEAGQDHDIEPQVKHCTVCAAADKAQEEKK